MSAGGLLALCAVLGLSATSVRGDTIASWENNHLTGNEESTTSGEEGSAGLYDSRLVEAPVLVRGPGATASEFHNSFGLREAHGMSLSDALASECYLAWTVQAPAGMTLSFDELFLRLSSQNADVEVALFSSATGGFDEGSEIATWTSATLVDTKTIELADQPALQDVADAIEFRLYFWGKPSKYSQVGIGQTYHPDATEDLRLTGRVNAP